MWVVLSLISAFLLGFYDIFKKQTVVDNAIIPVLFYSTMISSLIFLPFVLSCCRSSSLSFSLATSCSSFSSSR